MRASAAIPAVFPAVEIEGGPAAGWYFDGGTRLNAPIKPALSLGAERVIVIGLNSVAPGGDAIAGPVRPDLFAGAAQIVDALLADPLVEDMQTLVTINELVGEGAAGAPPPGPVHLRRAAAARHDRRDRPRGLPPPLQRAAARASLAAGRVPRPARSTRARDALHGELLSYLFFAPEFAHALIERGRADAEAWLEEPHDDGLWDTGPLGRHALTGA